MPTEVYACGTCGRRFSTLDEWVADQNAHAASPTKGDDECRAELTDLRYNLALRAFTAPDEDDAVMLESLDARIRDALASPTESDDE